MAAMRQFAGDCETSVPTLLPYVGTVDVARDMDRLRQALGDAEPHLHGPVVRHPARIDLCQTLSHPRTGDGPRRRHRPRADLHPGFSGAGAGVRVRAGAVLHLVRRHVRVPVAPSRRSDDRVVGARWVPRRKAVRPRRLAQVSSTTPCWTACTRGATGLSSAPRSPQTPRGTPRRRRPCPSTTTPADPRTPSMQSRPSTASTIPVSHNLGAYSYLADVVQGVGTDLRPLLAWGRGPMCGLASDPPTRRSGPCGAGRAADSVGGDDGGPGDAVQLGGRRVPRARPVVVAHGRGHDHVAYFYSGCVRDEVQSYLVGGATPAGGATCAE